MRLRRSLPKLAASILISLILVSASAAQTPHAQGFNPPTLPVFTSLVSFNGTDGADPGEASLVQGTDGNLYGITGLGGAYNHGTVFQVTTAGALTTLYSFCAQSGCPDGSYPGTGLVQGTDGNFYGVTGSGGINGYGTVFKITSDGVLTTLHSFDGTDSGSPYGLLIQSNGNFYGTTYGQGVSPKGSVFKISASGTLTTLYNFCSQIGCADGANPYAGLVQASDGNFYGTTSEGGDSSLCKQTQPYGCGTVFKITPGGNLTTLHSFAGYPDDGNIPSGNLVQANDLNLYGTTEQGGGNNSGVAFKITLGGVLTTIYSFCAPPTRGKCPYGAYPYAGFVHATDGNLYGTAFTGGANGYGMVYKLTTLSKLATQHSFDLTDGAYPYAALVQGTNGSLYSATQNGGVDGDQGVGTLFNPERGLAPFVETQTAFGKVGSSVGILGTNLTGATSVTFNGTAAAFTVVSNSEIRATVPTGATTGSIVVTTPGGTLKSNKKFRVVA